MAPPSVLLSFPIALILVTGTCGSQAEQEPEGPRMPADTEVQTTASGLRYSVLKAGSGAEQPRFGDRVRVHYSGWTTDGTLFDSSVKRGEPSEFGLGQVIEGWNEGLALMSPGARFKFTIPSDLAYGDEGHPPVIPPKATLVFEVELIAITARAMAYVAWQEGDGVETGESGLEFRYLVRGEGRAAAKADLVQLEYALYDPAHKPVLCSSMDGSALMGMPEQMPLPFMTEAMGFLREGDRVLLRVPPALGFSGRTPPGIDAQSPTLWQLELKRAMTFTTPDFSLPSEDELTRSPSGLGYRVLRPGGGPKPKSTSQVTVHYQGWLTDGTSFDGSYERGQPATFGLNRVIPGWTEGLQLVGEGGMIQLLIPPALGYGERGSPPVIPANATLLFTIEVIQVQ